MERVFEVAVGYDQKNSNILKQTIDSGGETDEIEVVKNIKKETKIMKLVKLLILALTIFSMALITGCGALGTDYSGKWYSMDSEGILTEVSIEKQEKSYLVTHKAYWYDADTANYRDPYHLDEPVDIDLYQIVYLENKLLPINEKVLDLGKGTLVYKDGKFVGKPNNDYKKEIVLEKDTQNNPKLMLEKAKKQFEQYNQTLEKPIDPKRLRYHDDKLENCRTYIYRLVKNY